MKLILLALNLASPSPLPQGFGPQQVLTSSADGAVSVCAADLDGDGDCDVLRASHHDDKVAWHKNTGGGFAPQQIISTIADGLRCVHAADLDGDGDQDVISASSDDDAVTWYKNQDGLGSFGPPSLITNSADAAWHVASADLDGDGDTDVLSASYGDDKIAWYENADGNGAFGIQNVISLLADGARSVHAADLDNDGDMDVLSASVGDDKIAWYENSDGGGGFGPQAVITTATDLAWSVYASDLDGDGDQDVLSASNDDGKVAWYENQDGAGGFGPQQIITTQADGARSVMAANFNGNGEPDVLSASAYDGKVAWYPNVDESGAFEGQQVISSEALFPVSAFASDLDLDGDPDVLSASADDDTVAWYENLMDLLVSEVEHVPAFSEDPVVIHGQGFGSSTSVLLDGVPAKISSLTPTSITIQPAPGAPELLDLTAANAVSSVTLADGLALWPTLSAETSGIGGSVALEIWNGEPGLYALALATGFLPAPIPIASPPTWYGVLLDPFGPLFTIGSGAFATSAPVQLVYRVPDNPALAGLSIYLQGWCQQGFFGSGVTYSFTNLASVTL